MLLTRTNINVLKHTKVCTLKECYDRALESTRYLARVCSKTLYHIETTLHCWSEIFHLRPPPPLPLGGERTLPVRQTKPPGASPQILPPPLPLLPLPLPRRRPSRLHLLIRVHQQHKDWPYTLGLVRSALSGADYASIPRPRLARSQRVSQIQSAFTSLASPDCTIPSNAIWRPALF